MTRGERGPYQPLGEEGVFKRIKKEDLRIEEPYQRNPKSVAKINRMARYWEWAICGTLRVIDNGDGTYNVVDGVHRVKASMKRKDIKRLPCMVYSVSTVQDEARVFRKTNKERTSIGTYDDHKAALIEEDPLALKVKSVMDDFSLIPKRCSHNQREVSCIKIFYRCTAANELLFRQCIGWFLQQDWDVPINGEIIAGIFSLAYKMDPHLKVMSEKYIDKLSEYSLRQVQHAIADVRMYPSCRGANGAAKAIADLINAKLTGRTRRILFNPADYNTKKRRNNDKV